MITWFPEPTTTAPFVPPDPPPLPTMDYNVNLFEILELRKRIDKLEKKVASLENYCEWLRESLRNDN